MLLALIPLFDENMAVKAYSVFSQRHNFLLNPIMLGTGQNDGSARVDGLELIERMGIETLSDDKEIFVPLSNISFFPMWKISAVLRITVSYSFWTTPFLRWICI